MSTVKELVPSPAGTAAPVDDVVADADVAAGDEGAVVVDDDDDDVDDEQPAAAKAMASDPIATQLSRPKRRPASPLLLSLILYTPLA